MAASADDLGTVKRDPLAVGQPYVTCDSPRCEHQGTDRVTATDIEERGVPA
jgi:hypothetical protein